MGRLKVFLLLMILMSCNIEYQENFDSNGIIESKLPLNRKGIYDGIGYYYYPNGQIAKKVTYEENQIIFCRAFYESGSIYWQSAIKEGKKDGEYFEFHLNGKLKKEVDFDEGIRYSYKEYDTLGILNYETILLNKDSVPSFSDEFIFIEGNSLFLDSFKIIKLGIQSIPNSQISPIIINGEVRVHDEFKGEWLAKSRSNDTVRIGINIKLGNSESKIIGYKKVSTLPSPAREGLQPSRKRE